MAAPLGLDLASKRKRLRGDYVYHEDYRTRWNDNDMFHHLNNPIYGVLIDSIINSYLMQKTGYSTSQSEYIALVGSSYCDFFGQTNYPGMLDVGLRVVRMGKSSLMYEVGIFKQGEEQVKAVGGFIQIWVERKSQKPTSLGIPPHVRRELEPLLKGSEQDSALPSKL